MSEIAALKIPLLANAPSCTLMHRTSRSMNLTVSILRPLLLPAIFIVQLLPSQWEKIPASIDIRISAMVRSGTNMFAATHGKGVYRSTDEGITWTPIGPAGTFINSLAVQDGYLFAGSSTLLYRTEDTSDQWIQFQVGPQYEYQSKSVQSLLTDGAALIAGTKNGVYRSTDHGASWNAANAGITLSTVKALAMNGADLFAAIWIGSPYYVTGRVYKTADAGAHWSQQTTGTYYANCFVRNGIYFFAGISYGGIIRTWDNGTSWSTVNNGLPPNSSVQSLLMYGSTVVAGMNNGLVCHSTDNGASWSSSGTGIPGVNVYALSTGSVYLYAGTDSGLFRLPLSSLVTAVRNDSFQPETNSLDQNVPNPFNPSTKLTCRLSSAGHTTLTVYDLLGRPAAVLMDEQLEPGSYTVQFDARRLSSGIYFAVLRSNGYSTVRRMNLIR